MPLLMVPQLWLWRTGGFIISADSMAGYLDMTWVQSFVLGHSWEVRSPVGDADVLVGLLMARFIDNFGKAYSHKGIEHLTALDLFENRVVGILSEVGVYVGTGISEDVEFAKERYFTHVVSDVRSELGPENGQSSASGDKQSLVLSKAERAARSSENWARVEGAEGTLKKYKKRERKIDGDAERVEKAIQDLLNLKRTHASIQDAHSSLVLSTAVIGFAVVTIVFAPLAFLTGLFALKVEGFRQLQTIPQDDVYDSGKLSGIFVSAEILTLILTFLAENIRRLWNDMLETLRFQSRVQQRGKEEKRKEKEKGSSPTDTGKIPTQAPITQILASAVPALVPTPVPTVQTSVPAGDTPAAKEQGETGPSESTLATGWFLSVRRTVRRQRNASPEPKA
ncbi:hypothetical protein CC86DRAFT_410545 [Ophiobolus disseminans]|uniref:Uncharacterized protein n=1 Tax=Ophiobolus disseminans TaxID=1469910 RepID=A0A6A6ZM22_9PLEO|nr:hypothetical protein CC86DRAFT_410545 [Ophiobolus disseminans]